MGYFECSKTKNLSLNKNLKDVFQLSDTKIFQFNISSFEIFKSLDIYISTLLTDFKEKFLK